MDERRVYVDSCCFIDMVKIEVSKTLTTDKENDVWFLKRLLEAHRDGEIKLFTSTITIAECSHIGDETVSDEVKAAFTRILMSGQYVRLVQPTPFIAIDARDLRWRDGIALRGADAIHVASALDQRCEEILSGDKRIERLIKASDALAKRGLYPKAARNTACLPPKYRQMSLDQTH